jgi:hypothetical protein
MSLEYWTICIPGHRDVYADVHPEWEPVSLNQPDPDTHLGLLHTYKCKGCGKLWVRHSYYCDFSEGIVNESGVGFAVGPAIVIDGSSPGAGQDLAASPDLGDRLLVDRQQDL